MHKNVFVTRNILYALSYRHTHIRHVSDPGCTARARKTRSNSHYVGTSSHATCCAKAHKVSATPSGGNGPTRPTRDSLSRLDFGC